MTAKIISPESAARQFYDAEFDPAARCQRDVEEIPHALQKACTDRGDREGLAFWRAVYTQYLLFDSHFDLTGCLPNISNDDVTEYLAMVFWDDGWSGDLDSALWSAGRHRHPGATAFFKRMVTHKRSLTY